MVKTSVIVPVYNVEKYLPRCLDSLVNQTLRDIEIICINDESPDNCSQILSEYQKKDKRIIVLNQKNSGQGSARNRGLEIAKGKYIQFLDSDDFYEPTCCEEMLELMERHKDIDVACFDTNIIYEAYEDKKEGDSSYFKMRYFGKTKIKPFMAHQLIDVNCWNKIFRKSFIDKYNLRFPENLRYEDVGFFWFWITRVKYAYFYRKKLTNYIRREGSFLGEIYTKSSKTIFDAFKVNELIYNDLVKNQRWEEYKEVYLRSYLVKVRWLIDCFSRENWQDKETLLKYCSKFLSQFDISNTGLDDYEINEFNNIIQKNYFVFGAFQNYEIEFPNPKFENGINICFCSDKKYIPYLSVAIQSIIENSSLEYNYDIVILYSDVYDFQKRFLLSMIRSYPNISIRFFNMNKYIRNYHIDKFYTRADMSLAAYYRLFIGDIFKRYKKILYLDCDLIVTKNISEIFYISLRNHALGVCLDTNISNYMYGSEDNKKYMLSFREYMRHTFKYFDSKKYFNSGVMLIDINEFNKIPLSDLLELSQKNTKFYHDQNVLNVAFKDDYIVLPGEWNTQSHIKYYPTYKSQLPVSVIQLYDNYDNIPAIIHYTYHPKVWLDPYKQWANIWWEYARKSPFYEIILKENAMTHSNKEKLDNGSIPYASRAFQSESYARDAILYRSLYVQYTWCCVLSRLTLGQRRNYYKQRKEELHERVRHARAWIKGS